MTEKQINNRIRHLIKHSSKMFRKAKIFYEQKHYISFTELNNKRMCDVIAAGKWFKIRKEQYGY